MLGILLISILVAVVSLETIVVVNIVLFIKKVNQL